MIEYIGVGNIPIRNYLVIMDRRCYSPELAIEYTKDIYGVDISEEVKKVKTMWDYNKDVYKLFEVENPSKKIDDGNREYFDNIGRRRYYKFYRNYKENDGYWDIIIDWCLEASVTHHIFPLVYGGDSNLMNLIPVTDFNHKLLHENSVEKKRECCFMAVDYLSYLHSWDSLKVLNDKYNMMQYNDFSKKFKHEFFMTIFESEINDFYKTLKEEYLEELKESN